MRAPNVVNVVLLMFCYIHSSEMHALVYDKLFRVLTTSEWSKLILNVAGLLKTLSMSVAWSLTSSMLRLKGIALDVLSERQKLNLSIYYTNSSYLCRNSMSKSEWY